ncbi:MAG: oligoendopeptidase F [Candidatus Nealsonbacteria bacterium]|nr:oligoendopeptidase F [Candidatus Nealsonbacteria bacterium]
MSKAVQQLPARSKVKKADTWDLGSLFADDAAWERAFGKWEKQIGGFAKFQGKLDDAKLLAACLKFDLQFDRSGERLGIYAFLKMAEDTTDEAGQTMQGRYVNVASRAGEAASYIRPEILALSAVKLKRLLADRRLAPYRLMLERLIRYKPHTLGKKEEKLLAMQTEMARASGEIFRQLNDADMKFPAVKDEKGQWIELSHAAFSTLLHSPKRSVRRTAFAKYYQVYADHQHTLAASLGGSIQRDVYYARARNHAGSLRASLFPDCVPPAVFDNLIESVGNHLPALHRYYDVRRRKMRLREIHQYDTYVPILSELQTRYPWNQAVKLVIEALAPLGNEYCAALEKGLASRWCDRYENRGKQSGAFSCGSFDGDPYILMNYQPDVLDHVFTLAHEAGHSMHSFYSARKQPYQYYDYAIFVAEVASTLNEQLLSRHMLEQAGDDRQRAFLVNRQIDAMRGTIFRQTMFAEFEKITHAAAEAGEPLTLQRFTQIHHDLLVRYFGPDFTLDEQLDLECFRIPHFYRAFYVYKYATGMSAAIALAGRVTGGGNRELDDYLNFLGGGCSKDPLDLLRDAGVDMEQPAAVDTALETFAQLVNELDELL